jgi:hypothetical protein
VSAVRVAEWTNDQCSRAGPKPTENKGGGLPAPAATSGSPKWSLLSRQMVKVHEPDLATSDVPERWKIVVADRTKNASNCPKGIGPSACGAKSVDSNLGAVSCQNFISQKNRLI